MDQKKNSQTSKKPRVAIIGMVIRCPGATNVGEFWSNLKNGVESISFFTEDELRNAGISDAVLQLPSFIRAGAPLEGLEMFDAEYFKYSAREAEFIDPQQRVFLECAVEALETAGVDPARFPGPIGVFAGEGQTHYGYQILANRSVIGVDRQMAVIGNDKDYLATRTSYKLGLRGPSLTIQCACSTSTVAMHLAMQSLLAHECDLALAGGVSVSWLRGKGGYHYVEGGILSRDGHTRAFDANASGTVFADGVAIAVLKRLDEAVADGDDIQAVILGTAVNNDGATKGSYTAPSIDGQFDVLSDAMSVADISPETIGYVEAHGTGTALGDPIEIDALQRVFRTATDKKQFCGVGSLKTNMGHLNTISGLAGTIKAALCVKTGEIPPSLHFEKPNPKIDFANSPFYVPTKLTKWSPEGRGARASARSVSAAPTPKSSSRSRRSRSPIRQQKACTWRSFPPRPRRRSMRPAHDLPGICASIRRKISPTSAIRWRPAAESYAHARAVVCAEGPKAAQALELGDPSAASADCAALPGKPVTFLFPGQGSQHIYMGRELYKEEPVFRRELDTCAEILRGHTRHGSARRCLYPEGDEIGEAEKLLRNTQYTQPAIFAVSYALAKLWMSFGVRPAMALGHSIGEFVAACLAEVFSLEDALRAVAERGRLIQSMPGGAMLAIMCPAEQAEPLFPKSVSLGAINTPTACVASGPREDIAALEAAAGRKRHFLNPLAHLARLPFGDDGAGSRALRRSDARHRTEPAATALHLQCHRRMDHRRAGDQPHLLGPHMRAAVLFHKGLSCIHRANAHGFPRSRAGPQPRDAGARARRRGDGPIVSGACFGTRRGRSPGFPARSGGTLGPARRSIGASATPANAA